MSKKKNFTKEQKHLIRQCMLDSDIMSLGKQETIDYVKSRLNLDFSEGSYKKFRSEVLNDETITMQWISYYARQGFVEFYRKRIQEMEMIQKETLKQWHIEMNKPDLQKDNNLIVKLVAELRANNQQLTSLGMVTPIIATIKNLIDKKEDKNKEENAKRIYPIQYQISREDVDSPGAETDNGTTTTAGDPIHNMVPRDMDDSEEIC